MPGVDLTVRVVGLGSSDPEFKSHPAVELIPGGVDAACHPSEVGKMSASLLVSCDGVETCPGLCSIAKETASAATTLCTEYGPNEWNRHVRRSVLCLLSVLPIFPQGAQGPPATPFWRDPKTQSHRGRYQ